MASKEEDMVHPKTIQFDDVVVDLCFHPSKNVIAAGDITGEVTLHSYSTEKQNSLLMTLNHHKKACRAIRFSGDGNQLYTASKDKSIQTVDLNTGAVKTKISKAHNAPIYSLLETGDNFVATGDDDGHLKVWDMRTNSAIMEMKESEEFISDMAIDDQRKILLATSGDGTLTAFNIRKKRMELQSELFDSEFLSISLVKHKQKVICGSGEGVLNIFNWGEWGNISDRFPGHPMSVDCMIPITDSIVCTGSSDGIVRAVNILPNRFLGVVGEHEDFPVENLSLSHDHLYIASCSHDQTIKFWNIDEIKEEKVNTKKKAKRTNKPKAFKSAAKENFFAGLAEEGESSKTESKDDEEEEEEDSDDNDDDSDSDNDDDND